MSSGVTPHSHSTTQAAPGSTIRLGRVLAHKANGDIRFGTPYLEDVAVHAKVLDHMQGEKVGD